MPASLNPPRYTGSNMNCPVDNGLMASEDFGGINVFVCRDGCKGMWLTWAELHKLEDKNMAMSAAMQESLTWPEQSNADLPALKCPNCGEVMHRHLAEDDKQVSLDECYACGGFFLASGQLAELRAHEMTQGEEQGYADKLVNGLPEWIQAQAELQRDQDRAEAIRRFTRFVRFGYYGRLL
jgi:Zn-finger nucleic acid-binding protein